MSDNSIRLFCLVGKCNVLRLKVRNSDDIFDLRDQIRSSLEHRVLQNFDASDLDIWKLNRPVPIAPEASIAERISSDDSGSMLSGSDRISDVFPGNSMKEGYVSIVVYPKSSVVNERKRRLSAASDAADFSKRSRVNSVSSCPPRTPKNISSLSVNKLISPMKAREEVQPAIDHALEQCKQALRQLISQDVSVDTIKTFPQSSQVVLMNGLGDLHAIDDRTKTRIADLFSNRDRCVFNSSGSGKTTLLVEGLSHHWGFYIVALRDQEQAMGSQDLTVAIQGLSNKKGFKPLDGEPNLQQTVDETPAINAGLRILLSRLIMFDFFLDLITACGIQDTNSTSLKQKWTLLQIHPEAIIKADIFRTLSMRLNNVETRVLSAWIDDIITTISVKIDVGRLYLVLDEAQAISSTYDTHFLSGNGTSSRSILKCLLQAWDIPYELHRLISGTGLSLDVIRKSLCSHVAKPISTWDLFTETGCFDDPAMQAHYIIARVWPGKSESQLLPSERALLRRCWRWLRGRHRYTTGFVHKLCEFPHSPHLLLDRYIQHMTRGDRTPSEHQAFRPTDGKKYSESEPELSWGGKDTVFTGHINWRQLCHPTNFPLCQMTYTNLLKLATRTSHHILFKDVHQAVSFGITTVAPSEAPVDQVISGESKLELLLPEPLVIAGALMAFKDQQDLGIESYVAMEICNPEPSARGIAFELATLVMLAVNLNGTKPLRSIFHFASEGILGNFLDSKNAQLVSVLGWEGQKPITCPAGLYYGASPLLGFTAGNPEDVKSWCKGSIGVPILLPDRNMGPDIIALVQVEDQFLWLVCQVKALGQQALKKGQLEGAATTTDYQSFYRTKKNHPFGPKKYSGLPDEIQELLRVPTIPVIRTVISYPAMFKPGEARSITASMSDQALAVLKDPEDILDPDSMLLQALKNSRNYLLGNSPKPYTSWDKIFASDDEL